MKDGVTTTSRRVCALVRRVQLGVVRHPLVIVILLLILLAGGFWLRHRLTHVDENDAKTAGEVITIASRVDGWLIARSVMEGDHVRKGQILGELDTRDARLRLATLENNLAARDAQIRQTMIQRDTMQKTTVAGVDDARAQIAAAKAAIAVIEPQADLARSDFSRADALIVGGAVSRETWDHTHSTRLQQEASLKQAQSLLSARQATFAQATAQRDQVPMLEQQIEVMRHERAALAAQVDQVRQEIADRTLRAPCDGIVDKTFIHSGDYVQAGQWLMMLHDPNDIWVEASVKETVIGKVRVGQPVNIKVDAYPNFVLHGQVFRVGNAATNQFALLPSPNPSGNFTKITQRVPVRIAIEKPKQQLQPGLMVEVSFNVAN
jgi:membrane fusion protein (multidrug efflux system)